MVMVLCLLLLCVGQVPAVESKEFAKATQQAAVVATVRLVDVDAGTNGSGTLVAHDGPFAYVLTANHVVARAKKLHVCVYTAASYPKVAKMYEGAEVLAGDARADLAVVRFITRDTLPAPVKICPARMGPVGKDFAVLALGCRPDREPQPLTDVVKAVRMVSKPGEQGKTQCWETAKAQLPGRSGGPLLDRQGRLIGVASGTNDGKGYYIHLEEIHTFLKRNVLERLADPAPPPPKGASAPAEKFRPLRQAITLNSMGKCVSDAPEPTHCFVVFCPPGEDRCNRT